MKKVRKEKKSLNDWAIADFGQVFDFISTFQFPREGLSEEITQNGIQYIHYGDIHAKFRGELLDLESESLPFVMDAFLSQKELADKEFPFLKEGDLIIADVSEDYEGVGECVELKNLNGRKVIGGLHTFVARAKNGTTAPGLRTYLLKHRQVVRELRRIATGASVYGISKTNLARVKLTLPPLPEQRKIAAILSTWDRALDKIGALIEAKKGIKRGLMQVLLTGRKQLGQKKMAKSVPLPPGWHKKSFAEISEISPSCKTLGDKDKVSFLAMSDLSEDARIIGGTVRTYSEVTQGFTNFENGDILIAKITPCFENGKGALASGLEGGIGFGSTEFHVLRPSKAIDNRFLYLHSISYPFRRRGTSNMVGSAGQKRVPRDFVEQYVILLPPLPEQKRIADCLGALDREISLLENKAAKFREQKKGLMQKLLTGAVRVKV